MIKKRKTSKIISAVVFIIISFFVFDYFFNTVKAEDISLEGALETPTYYLSKFLVYIGSLSGGCYYSTFQAPYPSEENHIQSGNCNWSDWDSYADGNTMGLFWGTGTIGERWLKIRDNTTQVIYFVKWNWNGSEWSWLAPITGPRVWLEDPASQTEITDLDTIITIGYEGFDDLDYNSLYIAFKHPFTGISTDAKVYDFSVIGESGELEINLQNFNFIKNGSMRLYVVATYEGYQYTGGFLSGYGYNWTYDLTDDNYFLIINIEGYEDIFEITDFDSWYSENITRFDTPTAVVSAITDFLSPIFSYIGEFGNKISDYFNNNEAYFRGHEIGKSIPVFSYYLDIVSYFIGGFPFMKIFLIIIAIMLGIFIFRLVIRFIPHFGS